MNVIKVIKNLNKAETAYYEAKRELELTKADLQLHTEWSEVLDKPKSMVLKSVGITYTDFIKLPF